MPLITSISPAPKSSRFLVEVEGTPAATVSLEAVERLGLRVGGDFALVAEEVAREAAVVEAYDRALEMLAARGRSRADLRRQLVRKGQPPEAVDEAIERLVARGFLDDDRFARAFVRNKVTGAALGRRRLAQELFRHGVDRRVADMAIDEVLGEEGIDEEALIDRVARRKLRSLGALDLPTRRRRLYAFLARRGYDADAIRATMERVLPA